MILIGAGQGATLSPLTAAGIAGVASGLVNVAHQLGGSLGLGILVTVFAAADSAARDGRDLLAHRVATTLTVDGHARARPRRRADRPAAPGRRDGKVSNEVIHRVLRELDLEVSRLDL
jgi:hypothetical protein